MTIDMLALVRVVALRAVRVVISGHEIARTGIQTEARTGIQTEKTEYDLEHLAHLGSAIAAGSPNARSSAHAPAEVHTWRGPHTAPWCNAPQGGAAPEDAVVLFWYTSHTPTYRGRYIFTRRDARCIPRGSSRQSQECTARQKH